MNQDAEVGSKNSAVRRQQLDDLERSAATEMAGCLDADVHHEGESEMGWRVLDTWLHEARHI